MLFDDVLLELVEGVFGGLGHCAFHLLLVGCLIFLDACASLVVGLVVGLFTVDVPAEVFVDFLLFFLLEGVSVQVELVLADSLCLELLLSFGALLPVLLLLEHFGVVDIIVPVFLLERCFTVGNLCFVDLQLQLKILVDCLFLELPFEIFCNFSVVLNLLRNRRFLLTFLLLLPFILQLIFSFIQIS